MPDVPFIEILGNRLQSLHDHLAAQHGRAVWDLECRLAELEGQIPPPFPLIPLHREVSPTSSSQPSPNNSSQLSGEDVADNVDKLKVQLEGIQKENTRLRKELDKSHQQAFNGFPCLASPSPPPPSFTALGPLALSTVHEGQVNRTSLGAQVMTSLGPRVSTQLGVAVPTSCGMCGNIYMADSEFCRKCGAPRWYAVEDGPLERESAVHFDLGANENIRKSDNSVNYTEIEEALEISGCGSTDFQVISSDDGSTKPTKDHCKYTPVSGIGNTDFEGASKKDGQMVSNETGKGWTAPVRLSAKRGEAGSNSSTSKATPSSPRPFLQQAEDDRRAPARSGLAVTLPVANRGLAQCKTPSDETDRHLAPRHIPTTPLFAATDLGPNSGDTFKLVDVWVEQTNEVKKTKHLLGRKSHEEGDEAALEDIEDLSAAPLAQGSCERRVMIPPGSKRHLFWEILSLFLIAYDCVLLPLEAFEPPKTTTLEAGTWIVRCFWTLNIVMSCLIGFLDKKGEVVIRPQDVQRHYACTWLLFDLLLVGFDWAEVVMDTGRRTAVSGLSAMRAVRMVRLARLFRLVRARQLNDFILRNVRNEFLELVAPILKGMIFLIGLTHIIACIWYAVGRYSKSPKTWLRHYGLETKPLSERYVWSFHCALALFTGEHVVQPQNTLERCFTVIVLTFTFLISAYFVSSITTAMTRLLIVAGQRSAQFTMLRRYLMENNISHQLAAKVQRSAKHAYLHRSKHVEEGNVELLMTISEPLLWELHYEVRFPVLRVHPFIDHYSMMHRTGIRKLCHNAVSRLSFSKTDVVFSEGEAPAIAKVLFIIDGKLQYFQKQVSRFQNVRQRVTTGNWVTEAVLWTTWVHRGTLCAAEEVQLMSLDASRFQSIVSRYPSIHVSKYAQEFVKYLANCRPEELTDVGEANGQHEKLASNAFESTIQRIHKMSDAYHHNSNSFAAFRQQFSTDGGIVHSARSSWSASRSGGSNRGSPPGSKRFSKMGSLNATPLAVAGSIPDTHSISRVRDSVHRVASAGGLKPRDSVKKASSTGGFKPRDSMVGIVSTDTSWGIVNSVRKATGWGRHRLSAQ